MKKSIIKCDHIVNEGSIFSGWIEIINGRIQEVTRESHFQKNISEYLYYDFSDKTIIPGIIDDQVHFREPGLTEKGNIYTESKAAVAGGITSFMEMPNTIPQTINLRALEQKHEIAAKDSFTNYSFYIGATNDNISEIVKLDSQLLCGIKAFLGSSTGNMLMDDDYALEKLFAESQVLVATHCEEESVIKKNLVYFQSLYGEDIPMSKHSLIRSEEACYLSTLKAINLAEKYKTRLHVLHLSTAKELSLFNANDKLQDKRITNEVCVHHLFFNDSYYEKLGNSIKWNPSIKTEFDQKALFDGLKTNHLDIIATDHAPHTLNEKQQKYLKCPSGGPMVQHSLNIMLEFVKQKQISLEEIVNKMCHSPALIFKVKERGFLRAGYWADFTVIDLDNEWIVDKTNILYKCGWSPLENMKFSSKITHTFVNGNLVYENGIIHEDNRGNALNFNR